MGYRRYQEQFKRETVRLITEEGYSVVRAAEAVGVPAGTVRYWVRRYAGAPGRAAGSTGELDALREENRRLRMERDILKKAAAFFAKEGP